MEVRKCPETGKTMHRGVRPMTISYKGQEATFDMPGWYAQGVEDGIHDGTDMKVSDRELTKLKARVEGLLVPEQVRRIRKSLKLTQKAAGTIIGGGPRAFQKYESGDILISRAVMTALVLLNKHPEEIEELKKLRT